MPVFSPGADKQHHFIDGAVLFVLSLFYDLNHADFFKPVTRFYESPFIPNSTFLHQFGVAHLNNAVVFGLRNRDKVLGQ